MADLKKVQNNTQLFIPPTISKELELETMGSINFRHTLRFEVRDHPGIFGHYGKIFERYSINIYALEQLPQYHRIGKEREEIVIFTLTLQKCNEDLVLKALKEINQAEYLMNDRLPYVL